MSGSLFSEQWYRVADMKPRLRAQVKVQRQRWRDQLWYILSDDATGRHHRINDAAYQFIGRCDGRQTVHQVWEVVLEALGDGAPTQDEVIDLLAKLYDGELLQFDRNPEVDILFLRQSERAFNRQKAMVNPLSFRLPLGDPTPWLARLQPVGRLLFRPLVFWLWMIVVLLAMAATVTHWDILQAHTEQHMTTPRYLALTWICFPLIKTLHELGHGLAVRHWSGEVHEFGVSLLVLVPAPYVDATAASAFLGRGERVLVSASGIMVELGLAALAMLVWLNSEAGWIKDIAFVVMIIGSVSTLLFNSNPLLRFDGYYILTDLLDLPNLSSRSNAYWLHLLRRHLLRLHSETPQIGHGERKWLILYAPLSYLYRVLISIQILFWIGSKWFVLGILTGVYLLFSMLLQPLLRWGRQALNSAAPGRETTGVRFKLSMLALVPGLLLFALPFPFATLAPAVVWLPDQAYIRPDVDGFVNRLVAQDGQMVKVGDLIAELGSQELVANRDRVESRLLGLRAEHYQLLLRDPLGAQNQAEEIIRTEAELARAEERLGQLQLFAKSAGRLVMPRQADLPGRFAKQGVPLGYVLTEGDALIRAAVPVEDAFLVQQQTIAAEVRLIERNQGEMVANLRPSGQAATRRLPSPALGDRAGGPYATDTADKEGVMLLEPVFLFDLSLPGEGLERVGQRAWVRFDHGFQPLAMQAYRRLSQLFLKHFNPVD